MSTDILKTLTISFTSSLCTAVFIVAGTALAESVEVDPSVAAEEMTTDGEEGEGNGGEDDPVDELASMKAEMASLRCFVGHMTDNQNWVERATSSTAYPGYWTDIDRDSKSGWDQGPNSDAKQAYDACFSVDPQP